MVDVTELLLPLWATLISIVRCELSAEECLQLGFRRADLLCSSCDLLPKFNLDHIKTNCDLCCQQGGSKQPIKKYPSARLEVCG